MNTYINEFLKRFDLPEPTEPYDHRLRNRLAYRNERNLYKLKCALTGKDVISMYSKDSPFPIYSPEAWYSDKWDVLKYGQDFDFSRPFFDQFYDLQCKVPRISNILVNTVNCDYSNIIGECKNCYLIFGSINCEDCLYGSPYACENCVDSLIVRNSQYCYECVDCDRLYECFYCQDCANSRNLWYCYDVSSSENCFLCVGLRRTRYCILNKQYTKEEYEKYVIELKKKNPKELREMLNKLREKTPVRPFEGINNENVLGDHVNNSRNCFYIFNSIGCEDVYYSTQMFNAKDSIDCDHGEIGGFNYGTMGFYKSTNLIGCHWVWDVANLYYSSTCAQNTTDCFGGISLQHKKYCILNKQYTKEEYEKMVPRIINHMKETGEWGKFFPIKYSPFAYNETVAFEYYPVSKEEAVKNGWKWNDKKYTPPHAEKIIDGADLSNSADDIPADITDSAIKCKSSDKLFKLTSQEVSLYKKFNLGLPKYHPNERHNRRVKSRNPRELFDRHCSKCGADIKTSYANDSKQIVYCEDCYLNKVY